MKSLETLTLEAQLLLANKRYDASKYMPMNMESFAEQRAAWFYRELIKERILIDHNEGDKPSVDWLAKSYNLWTVFKKDLKKQGEKNE